MSNNTLKYETGRMVYNHILWFPETAPRSLEIPSGSIRGIGRLKAWHCADTLSLPSVETSPDIYESLSIINSWKWIQNGRRNVEIIVLLETFLFVN